MLREDHYLKEVFPLPHLVAYRRPPNTKDKLLSAKLPAATTQRQKSHTWHEQMQQLSHLSICENWQDCQG